MNSRAFHSVVASSLLAGAGLYLYARKRKISLSRREGMLEGKVAVVTGGTRGLGYLIARELAREGCKLVIAARDEDELGSARDRLRLEASPVWTVAADLTKEDDAQRIVREAIDRFGRIDILINNAGAIQVAPLESLTEEDFHDAMDLMFWGTLRTSLAALPSMRAQKSGSIVNIVSFGGVVAVPHMLPYSAAKFAQYGLSQGLHTELSRHGIAVTTVLPGTMRTGSHVRARFGGHKEREYRWFTLGATLPILSSDAERAARRIVRAIKRRDAVTIIGLPFQFAVRLQGIFPNLTAGLLSVVNRLLPRPAPRDHRPRLIEGQSIESGPILDALATLGERARFRYQ